MTSQKSLSYKTNTNHLPIICVCKTFKLFLTFKHSAKIFHFPLSDVYETKEWKQRVIFFFYLLFFFCPALAKSFIGARALSIKCGRYHLTNDSSSKSSHAQGYNRESQQAVRPHRTERYYDRRTKTKPLLPHFDSKQTFHHCWLNFTSMERDFQSGLYARA